MELFFDDRSSCLRDRLSVQTRPQVQVPFVVADRELAPRSRRPSGVYEALRLTAHRRDAAGHREGARMAAERSAASASATRVSRLRERATKASSTPKGEGRRTGRWFTCGLFGGVFRLLRSVASSYFETSYRGTLGPSWVATLATDSGSGPPRNFACASPACVRRFRSSSPPSKKSARRESASSPSTTRFRETTLERIAKRLISQRPRAERSSSRSRGIERALELRRCWSAVVRRFAPLRSRESAPRTQPFSGFVATGKTGETGQRSLLRL